MINKYGTERVARANQVETLLVEQTEDKIAILSHKIKKKQI
jgi:hypothetical protein